VPIQLKSSVARSAPPTPPPAQAHGPRQRDRVPIAVAVPRLGPQSSADVQWLNEVEGQRSKAYGVNVAASIGSAWFGSSSHSPGWPVVVPSTYAPGGRRSTRNIPFWQRVHVQPVIGAAPHRLAGCGCDHGIERRGNMHRRSARPPRSAGQSPGGRFRGRRHIRARRRLRGTVGPPAQLGLDRDLR